MGTGSILCRSCEADFGFSVPFHRCPDCGGPLSFSLDRSFPLAGIAARPPGMWRYREALPAFEDTVSLGEQPTPLVAVPPREFGRTGCCSSASTPFRPDPTRTAAPLPSSAT